MFGIAAATALALAAPQVANAGLIYDSSIALTGQGFGSAPRALTVQGTGNASTESGCVGVNGSGIVVGASACLPASTAVHDSNGVANLGGDEPNPRNDNQKYGIPTVDSLGISSADELGILFNATEPGGDGLSIVDLTLKFYDPTGTLLGAIDGSYDFASTQPGNGVAGFVFRVSDDEQEYVDSLLGPGVRLALESTLSDVGGGPESFLFVDLGDSETPQVPAPATLGLLGLGLAAFAAGARRRRDRS